MYRELYGSDAAKRNKGVKWSAEQIADQIMLLEVDEPRNRWHRPDIAISVADPAMLAEDGGPSIAEQMARRGVVFIPADNTRISRDGKMAGWTRCSGADVRTGVQVEREPHALRFWLRRLIYDLFHARALTQIRKELRSRVST
jgi:hypothetical protein